MWPSASSWGVSAMAGKGVCQISGWCHTGSWLCGQILGKLCLWNVNYCCVCGMFPFRVHLGKMTYVKDATFWIIIFTVWYFYSLLGKGYFPGGAITIVWLLFERLSCHRVGGVWFRGFITDCNICFITICNIGFITCHNDNKNQYCYMWQLHMP